MAELSFEIVTPDGLKFQANVWEAIIPTPDGYIAVLPHHMPLISLVATGIISIRHRPSDPDEALEHLATTGGFVEISRRRIRVLADSAERADDIDELRAQEAITKAKELQHTTQDTVALADVAALIEQNTARLKVTELRRRSKRR